MTQSGSSMLVKVLACGLVALSTIAFFAVTMGCSGDPELHQVVGTVTLAGTARDRLLVYFRPMAGKVNQWNMGVGETDAEGNLSLRSTAGLGVAEGRYRISFSCLKQVGINSAEPIDRLGKPDDNGRVEIAELVPAEYADPAQSPVEFTVHPGTNTFDYNIPVP